MKVLDPTRAVSDHLPNIGALHRIASPITPPLLADPQGARSDTSRYPSTCPTPSGCGPLLQKNGLAPAPNRRRPARQTRRNRPRPVLRNLQHHCDVRLPSPASLPLTPADNSDSDPAPAPPKPTPSSPTATPSTASSPTSTTSTAPAGPSGSSAPKAPGTPTRPSTTASDTTPGRITTRRRLGWCR